MRHQDAVLARQAFGKLGGFKPRSRASQNGVGGGQAVHFGKNGAFHFQGFAHVFLHQRSTFQRGGQRGDRGDARQHSVGRLFNQAVLRQVADVFVQQLAALRRAAGSAS